VLHHHLDRLFAILRTLHFISAEGQRATQGFAHSTVVLYHEKSHGLDFDVLSSACRDIPTFGLHGA
jgi:hypothetical protein